MFEVLFLLPDLGQYGYVSVPLLHVLCQGTQLGPDRSHVVNSEDGKRKCFQKLVIPSNGDIVRVPPLFGNIA